MKKIKLSQSKYCLVDDDDFLRFSHYKWYYSQGYAARNLWNKRNKNARVIKLHRLIINAKKGQFCDHVNGNKLDNRKSNLRICNQAKNQWNRTVSRKNTSGFKGVYQLKNLSWVAQIRTNGKRKRYIGIFKNKKDASLAYKRESIKYHREFSNTN